MKGACPQCRQPSSLAPDNRWRPFCSERCKLIDLGDWMSGRFVIPVEPGADADDWAETAPETPPPQRQ
jgi:endogenous inhibitor of DNA gyrase (YacG/DUF329 family)